MTILGRCQPSVPVSTRPTKSPIPVAKQVVGPSVNGKPVMLFKHRELAREYNRSRGVKGGVVDLLVMVGITMTGISASDRWAVFV